MLSSQESSTFLRGQPKQTKAWWSNFQLLMGLISQSGLIMFLKESFEFQDPDTKVFPISCKSTNVNLITAEMFPKPNILLC